MNKKESGTANVDLNNAAMLATADDAGAARALPSALAKPNIELALDDVGPQQGLLGNGSSTDDRAPRLSGTGQPGSIINIFDNGVKIGSARVGSNGAWSFQVRVPLELGEHQFVASGVGQSSDPFVLDVTGGSVATPSIESAFDNAGSQWGRVDNGGSTDDTTPELSGIGEPGSIVTIFDNGAPIGNAEVKANGTWNFLIDPALAAGEHRLVASSGGVASNPFVVNISVPAPAAADAPAVDPVGQVQVQLPAAERPPVGPTLAKPQIGSAYDDVGDQQGAVDNGGGTDDRTPLLSGTGQPGSIIGIFDGATRIGSARVGLDGNWSFQVRVPLTVGEHAFTVNGVGQTSDPFVLDITGADPVTPSIESAFDNAGPQWGRVDNGGSTDDTTPELSGTGEPGSTVTIFDNGQPIGSVQVGEQGLWNWTVTPALGAGPHSLVASSGGVASNPFVLEIEPPAAPRPHIGSAFDDVGAQQGAVGNGGSTDDSTPRLSGTGTPGGSVTLYDNGVRIGSAAVDGNGNWSFEVTPALPPGRHQFVVDGGTGLSDPFVLNIAAPAPAPAPTPGKPEITSAFDDVGAQQGQLGSGASTDDTRPQLSGSGKPFSIVNIFDNGVQIGYAHVNGNGSWVFPVNQPLRPGEHNLTVASGGAVSDPFVLHIDGVKPNIGSAFDNYGQQWGQIDNGGSTDDATPVLRGTGQPGGSVTIHDGDTVIGTAAVDAYGNWMFQVAPALAPGEHTFTVSGAGVSSDPFVLDITGPEAVRPAIGSAFDDVGTPGPVGNGGSTDDTTPRLSGTGEPNGSVTLYDGDVPIATVPVDGNGRWSLQIDQPLSAGQHSFTAVGAGVSSEPFVLDIRDVPVEQKPSIVGIEDRIGEDTGNIENGGSTDDPHPVLHGTGVPGTIIEILLVDGADGAGLHLGYADVAADGSWEWPLSQEWDLQGGTQFVASGEGGQSQIYTIDIQPGADTATEPAATVDDGLAALSLQDLLQSGDELFTAPADIASAEAGSVVLDTSVVAETQDGVQVAVPASPVQPWEVPAP